MTDLITAVREFFLGSIQGQEPPLVPSIETQTGINHV